MFSSSLTFMTLSFPPVACALPCISCSQPLTLFHIYSFYYCFARSRRSSSRYAFHPLNARSVSTTCMKFGRVFNRNIWLFQGIRHLQKTKTNLSKLSYNNSALLLRVIVLFAQNWKQFKPLAESGSQQIVVTAPVMHF